MHPSIHDPDVVRSECIVRSLACSEHKLHYCWALDVGGTLLPYHTSAQCNDTNTKESEQASFTPYSIYVGIFWMHIPICIYYVYKLIMLNIMYRICDTSWAQHRHTMVATANRLLWSYSHLHADAYTHFINLIIPFSLPLLCPHALTINHASCYPCWNWSNAHSNRIRARSGEPECRISFTTFCCCCFPFFRNYRAANLKL